MSWDIQSTRRQLNQGEKLKYRGALEDLFIFLEQVVKPRQQNVAVTARWVGSVRVHVCVR